MASFYVLSWRERWFWWLWLCLERS